ncbi:electron transfer flavoprotein subunit alpha/FixB family protein [Providencia rettgeri]|uniref:electron transfer flavoprotein subunit alpha/FixB family protein n=1 Tax=Providencia TaxID=586 RepID=UPI000E3CD88C|nr:MULTISPECIES: FAD-binding protein [Providencia]ELR5296544.1 FAD-binding protein [Providencia rettgeri]MBQ0396580.1 FAD-binding protein [Providencia rettgeri]MCL0003419.1 FAD-binding protein [Providencia rettgeri]MCL0014458.1 FAD-binding protein [Providencia rettgeri]RFT10007.1 electron transfer flavoprotein subunit alpha/FixB family protein [Providencia rettgeri]
MSQISVLVVVEHDNQTIKNSTYHSINAAKQLLTAGDHLHLLIAGDETELVAQLAASIQGVSKVLEIQSDNLKNQLAEPMAHAVVNIAKEYTHLLFPATTFGKNIAPRVAATLGVAQISDITQVIDSQTFIRPIYAGNALATVQNNGQQVVITVRSSAFSGGYETQNNAEIETISLADIPLRSQLKSQSLTQVSRAELSSAKVVISGGRGLSSGENFALLETIADKLGAAVGASRAAVDAGFVPNDYQVGQTGKIVAPELYIAVGISGAIQHVAGMKESKVIVAINSDPEAPIFQVADYGIVGDLFEILPEFDKALE